MFNLFIIEDGLSWVFLYFFSLEPLIIATFDQK